MLNYQQRQLNILTVIYCTIGFAILAGFFYV